MEIGKVEELTKPSTLNPKLRRTWRSGKWKSCCRDAASSRTPSSRIRLQPCARSARKRKLRRALLARRAGPSCSDDAFRFQCDLVSARRARERET